MEFSRKHHNIEVRREMKLGITGIEYCFLERRFEKNKL